MDREEILEEAGKFGVEVFALISTYLFLIVSAIASSTTGDGLWFSRSGSIVVIVSVIIEFRNYSIQQKLNEIAQDSTNYYGAEPDKWQVPIQRKIFDRTILFTIVFGSLVWGYGDLLF